jgi:phosphoheptose isomerase
MPTTVTARSVVQENREARAPVVQGIFSGRESLRGIESAADTIVQASRKRGRKINRRKIPALAASTSAATSTGKDQGFDPVFATQAEPFARPGGVFLGISASGDSRKILPAVRIAGGLQIEAIAWTGGTGGKVEKRRGRLPLHTVERSAAPPASTPFGETRFRNSWNTDWERR